MRRMITALTLAIAASAAASTVSAQTGSSGGGTGAGAGGGAETGGGDLLGPGDTLNLENMPPELRESIEGRRGPRQRPLELLQTTLLNRFGELGIAELNDFRKEGESYIATVTTVQGERMEVVIDPDTGDIVAQR